MKRFLILLAGLVLADSVLENLAGGILGIALAALVVFPFSTAIAGALIIWFFFPTATLMGASGVLFMMMVLASFASMRGGAIPITLILVLILYLGSEVVRALSGGAGLQELTHIAGGVVGMLLGLVFSRSAE